MWPYALSVQAWDYSYKIFCDPITVIRYFSFPQVYDNELEDIPEFKGLTDFCSTFKLLRGKNENGEDDPSVVGEFKVELPAIHSHSQH